jgi:hypothetical protein
VKVAIWLFALYVTLDLADPGMPGALNFDPDQSVEVVQVERLDIIAKPLVSAQPDIESLTHEPSRTVLGRRSPPTVVLVLVSEPLHRPRGRPPTREYPSASEEAAPAPAVV